MGVLQQVSDEERNSRSLPSLTEGLCTPCLRRKGEISERDTSPEEEAFFLSLMGKK